jgi:hypothetical protein
VLSSSYSINLPEVPVLHSVTTNTNINYLTNTNIATWLQLGTEGDRSNTWLQLGTEGDRSTTWLQLGTEGDRSTNGLLVRSEGG